MRFRAFAGTVALVFGVGLLTAFVPLRTSGAAGGTKTIHGSRLMIVAPGSGDPGHVVINHTMYQVIGTP